MQPVLVAAKDVGNNDVFKLAYSGTPVPDAMWNFGQPNHGFDMMIIKYKYDCARIFGWLLSTVDCDRASAFVCEIPMT